MAVTQEQQTQQVPRNIFEAIFYGVDIVNKNLVTLSQNLEDMQKQVDAMVAILNQPAPEKPNVPGEEGAVHGVNREQAKLS